MSQLAHYVNRRNVQAAVSQVWPIFSVGGSCFDKYCPEEKKGNFHIQPPGENWVTALFIKRINF